MSPLRGELSVFSGPDWLNCEVTTLNPGVVAILTALNLEYDAVRRLLTDVKTVPHASGTRFEVGTVRGKETRIALAIAGVGNQSAAVITERVITEFDPHAVLCVGIAGALQNHLKLGDVVVATQVYAYHSGTSQDHQFGARPRVWPAPHVLEQLAKQISRSRSWIHASNLDNSEGMPRVHFGPIAAGEVVIQSRTGEAARTILSHYNDAMAVEMEGAGVSLAGHLNQKPTLVIRGISDMANSEKHILDRAGWQSKAAENAVAFAITLANECIGGTVRDSSDRNHSRMTSRIENGLQDVLGKEAIVPGGFLNIAKDNAHVGLQVGQINGTVQVGGTGAAVDITERLLTLRREITDAVRNGSLDGHAASEAEKEIDRAEAALPHDTAEKRRRLIFAMKRLSGLVGDVAELATAVAFIITTVSGFGQ